MAGKLSFKYDRDADILYINRLPPYPEQESEEMGDDIIARFNPNTGDLENLEILFFSNRLFRNDSFEVPLDIVGVKERRESLSRDVVP